MREEVYTVVVNWNLAEETIACITSLLAAGAYPQTIIVVDNNSTDASVAELHEAFDGTVTVIENDRNLGFAGGTNVGIEHALADGAQRILLLNNDTVVAGNFWETLLNTAQHHPTYALLAPLILYYDEPERIWSLGDVRIPGTLITRSLYKDRYTPATLEPVIPVDYLNACAFLVDRCVFERIGLFDTSFFMYAEDVDFCWRAQRAGFRLACATRARVWHKVSRSTDPHSLQARRWRIGNQIRFYHRAAHGHVRYLMLTFTLLRSLRLATQDICAGRPALATTTLHAWHDAWTTTEEKSTLSWNM